MEIARLWYSPMIEEQKSASVGEYRPASYENYRISVTTKGLCSKRRICLYRLGSE